jgi:hypothetical protein
MMVVFSCDSFVGITHMFSSIAERQWAIFRALLETLNARQMTTLFHCLQFLQMHAGEGFTVARTYQLLSLESALRVNESVTAPVSWNITQFMEMLDDLSLNALPEMLREMNCPQEVIVLHNIAPAFGDESHSNISSLSTDLVGAVGVWEPNFVPTNNSVATRSVHSWEVASFLNGINSTSSIQPSALVVNQETASVGNWETGSAVNWDTASAVNWETASAVDSETASFSMFTAASGGHFKTSTCGAIPIDLVGTNDTTVVGDQLETASIGTGFISKGSTPATASDSNQETAPSSADPWKTDE